MSNATADIDTAIKVGQDGRRINLPVDGGSTIYKNTLVAQLQATGMVVAATTAGAGPAIGFATHGVVNSGADGAERLVVETDCVVRLTNGVWVRRRSDNVAVDLLGLEPGEAVQLREGAEVQIGQLYTLTITSRGA